MSLRIVKELLCFFHKPKKKGHSRANGLDSIGETQVMQRLKLKCFLDLHNRRNLVSVIANVSVVLSALYVLLFAGRRSGKV